MSAPQIHLLFNHFPILGTLFALCLLLYGVVKSNKSIEHAGLVTFVLVGLLTFPVWLTGEGSEEVVEHMQGVSELYIEKHESIGFWSFVVIAVNMLLSGFTLFRSVKGQPVPALSKLVLAIGIVAFGMAVVTGHYGGKINHPELRGSEQPTLLQYDDEGGDANGD